MRLLREFAAFSVSLAHPGAEGSKDPAYAGLSESRKQHLDRLRIRHRIVRLGKR